MFPSWVLIFLLWTGFVSASCPHECRCSEDTVDCSNRKLYTVPLDISPSTKTLNLRGNFLGKLSRADFSGLKQLDTLVLADNKIVNVEENVLDELPNLRRLFLGRNRLRELASLTSRKSPLLFLDLKHNKIETIDVQLLEMLTSLETLDLSHNRLQSVHSMMFQNAKTMLRMKMHRNPWSCDCRLEATVDFMRKLEDPEEHVHCFNPYELRGENALNLKPGDLSCFSAIETKFDSSIELACSKDGIGQPIWTYQGVEIEESASEDSWEIQGNGTLLVPKSAQTSDYKCAIQYSVSPRLARQARPAHGQSQSSAPQFTFKPKDSSYREGTPVKLHCEVTGEPRPSIQWYRNRQPLQSSRKFEMSQANSVLKIYPFLEGDVGTYTCVAQNIHGQIEHTARIHLISSVPPSIHDTPQAQSVEPGQQVTFRCRAQGVPKPEITWFFEGAEIPLRQGRFQTSDDRTELTITHVSRQDVGVYSCMAGNSVGAMMADARLTVTGKHQSEVDKLIDKEVLQTIVQQAKDNVNRAIASTRTQLVQDGVRSTGDLKRLFKFTIPKQAVELSKAREIYEESIRLVQSHVERGLKLPVNDLHPKNVSYESVLAVSHVQTIMELSGCQAGVFRNPCTDMCFHNKYRSYDGQCNNLDYPMWGVSQMPLKRLLSPIYENGFNTPIGWEKNRLYYGYPKPNPREVSRQLIATHDITPHGHLSSMVMQWGQFVDHDLTHTAPPLTRNAYTTGAVCNRTCENLEPCFNIQLPKDDPKLMMMTRMGKEVKYPCIEFERSGAVCGSGETSLIFDRVTYREQLNILTSYLDGSVVYGSSEVQALELRDLFGDHGLLRFDIVSSAQKPYMPFEKDSDMDCRRNYSIDNPIRCFLAGDLRANEQLGLTAMHTVFMREHNRVAAKFLEMNVNWDGETIFQETRKLIGAMIQHITYAQWLPLVLGKTGFAELIGPYMGYDPSIDSSVSNSFATAAFRFGHTLINPELKRLGKDFQPIPQGHIPLHEAFFAPERLLSEGGIDPLLRGLFATPLKLPRSSQILNTELTEKLFPRAHEVSLDLAVMNIQRGRDHGLPSWTEYRKWCNLSVPETWDQMAIEVPDVNVRNKLKALYGHPGNVDLWVGGVIETRMPDGLIGPTFACLIADQFKRARAGDRHWYENEGVFSKAQLQQIKKTSLARLSCDNGDDIDRVQKDVFFYPGNSTRFYEKCEMIPEINLNMWQACCEGQCSMNQDSPITGNRRRRAEKAKNFCEVEGIMKNEGEKWKIDKCTMCECKNAQVWCTVKEHCLD
ncbi:unnamed protein product, partial [Mesorhabditis belari]|uniref:Ig-like domain-containing protein n=1 Tax=Mesorhabditis belari TaxID=2138241 RepID=A0AAF3J5C3_9BILA